MPWPSKDEREEYEIKGFIDNYKRIPDGKEFEIIEKREKPDYFVKDMKTGEYFGVELTSVYLSDKSVPDEHIPTLRKSNDKNIPLVSEELDEYKGRILEAIKVKVRKANDGYDLRYPLILSVYVNEYRSIFMNRDHWTRLVNEKEGVFDLMNPFTEVLFWDLANNDVLLVRPERRV